MPLADLEVQGRTFAVTGTASGIGDAVARRLKAAGAGVVSLDIRAPEAPVDLNLLRDWSEWRLAARCVEEAAPGAVVPRQGAAGGVCHYAIQSSVVNHSYFDSAHLYYMCQLFVLESSP